LFRGFHRNPAEYCRQFGSRNACCFDPYQNAGYLGDATISDPGARIVKIISFPSAFQAAILATVFTAAGHAEDAGPAAFSNQDLESKLTYCKTCHGLSGEGYHGSVPIPRLAGQQQEYIENQLRAFIDRRRTNSLMSNVAHPLIPSMIPALAAHFSGLNPKPLGGAPKELVAAGKKIYEDGLPESNVPPCASCHGPDAKGNGQFPRLAGQLNDYIMRKLANWSKERGLDPSNPDTSAIMEPIAHSLTEPQVDAVAAYVNYLE
jgi:cytochrome c553